MAATAETAAAVPEGVKMAEGVNAKASQMVDADGYWGVQLRDIVLSVVKHGPYLTGPTNECYILGRGVGIAVERDTPGEGGKTTIDVMSGQGGIAMRMIFWDDVLHNEDGPAVIYRTTPQYVTAEWHVNGVQQPHAEAIVGDEIVDDAEGWVIVDGEVIKGYEPTKHVYYT